MTRRPLTPPQLDFLRLVLRLQRDHGAPPTIRELQAAGGFRSPRSVTQFLEALEKAGFIERTEGARNIRVLRVDAMVASESARTVEVPLVGKVAAGSPILAVQNIETSIPVSDRIAKPPHRYFFLRVEGDSMNRAGIKDGSLALVRQQRSANLGDTVVALIDEEATIKRLKRVGDMVVLEPVSSNPKHKAIIVEDDFLIQGVVVTTMPDITK